MRSKGYNQKHILLIGYSRAAEGFIDRVQQNLEWGYQVKGILDDHKEWGTEYKSIHVIGKVSDLDEILALNSLDEIAITLSIDEYANLEKIVLPVKNQASIPNLFPIIIISYRPVPIPRTYRGCRLSISDTYR